MAILCQNCGRQYDVTLFQFGRTAYCECGETVTLKSTIRQNGSEADAAALGYLVDAPADSLFIYIIRHGKTVWNKERRLQGQVDVELNEQGREEATLVAAALKGVPFEAIYTSDLRRSSETARIIGTGRETPVIETREFREQNYGEWSGHTYEEVGQLWPEVVAARERDRVNVPPVGGETLGQLQERVVRKMEEIAAKHTLGNVLVVTHGGPAFVFVSHVLAPEGQLKGNFTIRNCAINIVAHTRLGWKLQVLNDSCHLRK